MTPSTDSTLISFRASAELAQAIDSARGSKSRSEYLRLAVIGQLLGTSNEVAQSLAYAPDRKGKGGPRKHREPISEASQLPVAATSTDLHLPLPHHRYA